MNELQEQYVNREISWLQFNERVLQEAADTSVPLIDRIRFLGIFSNNLDEFFKVRYAFVKRIVDAGKGGRSALKGIAAQDLLAQITDIVIDHQSASLNILKGIYKELEKENIFVIDETQVSQRQHEFIADYFQNKVSPALGVMMLNDQTSFPGLQDNAAYLTVRMEMHEDAKILTDPVSYALIEIPRYLDRFIILPQEGDKQFVILLDDLIRYSLGTIFSLFNYKSIEAHMIKITRDAGLDMDSDLSKSFIAKISKSVKERSSGDPVRFVYDKSIHEDTLSYLLEHLEIEATDSVIPGGRYHYRRDYMKFPSFGRQDLLYNKIKPLPVRGLHGSDSILDAIDKKDALLYAPYHDFTYVIRFLREAALDPRVEKIKITIYRLAEISHIAGSLINAAKNGKEVTVQIELQARFDEEANIRYAEQMQQEGVQLIFGVTGLKVHCKACVIERRNGKKNKRYGFISTGNFNESTAKIYTDYTLFTANQKILKEVNKVFDFLEVNYKIKKYNHLIVSPHYTRNVLYNLIEAEIENHKKGLPSGIQIKLNNMSDYPMIDKLYEASQAGVSIKIIARGICCLIPGVEGLSENIEVISIVDKFLEHPRVFIFENQGDPKVYISSADFMTRNLDRRVEIGCPIYDPDIKQEIIDTFDISWKDNVKARVISAAQDNAYREREEEPALRSQFEMYTYYQKKLNQV
ncbi:polyphosphate kinase 1 [Gilvibacter sediminis]|uniref:polyphosphate kinase 1 n=1 Tax=Gilvibacter sediminis TaxID=379071 RepID=UPI00234FF92F|nr:polyphosphate kinase 1 [Gilvibacter sediminis]MDC7997744.1 polyphosphate kinase 1 [Gilvibacter sediminis]